MGDRHPSNHSDSDRPGRQHGDSASAPPLERARPIVLRHGAHDQLLSLPQVAAYLGRLTGKRPHVSTIWRWCLKGCKGVKLESICIGGKRFVETAAIDRFIDDSTARGTQSPAQPAVRTPRLAPRIVRHNERRRAEIEAARRRIDELTGVTKPFNAARGPMPLRRRGHLS